MDAELKAKWIEALRSGNYDQGQFLLRDANDNFCCLGVLADLIGLPWRFVEAGGASGGVAHYDVPDGLHTNNGCIPERVAEEIGLLHFASTRLMGMNDRGKSFAEIAQWIEEHL